MSLSICSINSGSNANCYYIGNDNEAILVDAGLSCRETVRRMELLQLPIERVKAIFVSHEHSDHITGVPGLSKKYQLPVYITGSTLTNGNIPLANELVRTFENNRAVQIGQLVIKPFQKSHDAADPYSFVISASGFTVGVITDIGYACKRVIKHFQLCDAVFLESNYCETMLANGNYPYHLKRRISSDQGHLSNTQALELFRNYRSSQLQLLILSHLSKNNNHPSLVENLFSPMAGTTKIVVASRYEASPVFKLEGEVITHSPMKKRRSAPATSQLSLF